MFEGIKNRWNNRGARCLKCQKKLVGKEKWVCKECREQLGETGVALLIAAAFTGWGIHSHNKKI